jgi:hypothetical protein
VDSGVTRLAIVLIAVRFELVAYWIGVTYAASWVSGGNERRPHGTDLAWCGSHNGRIAESRSFIAALPN